MKGRPTPPQAAGWVVRFGGAAIGWFTVIALWLVIVALVATVALCIYAATL